MARELPRSATYEVRRTTNALFVVEGQGDLVTQANTFLATITQRGFSNQTVRAYAYDLVVFFRWLDSEGTLLAEVDEAALLEYVGDQRKKGAKPRSINRRLSTCRLFIRHASGKEPERRVSSGYYPRSRARPESRHSAAAARATGRPASEGTADAHRAALSSPGASDPVVAED